MSGRRATDHTFDRPEQVRDLEITVSEKGEVDGVRVERIMRQRFITLRVYHIWIISVLLMGATVGGAFAIGLLAPTLLKMWSC